MSYFIYTDLISSLLDPRLVDLETLINVGAYMRHVMSCVLKKQPPIPRKILTLQSKLVKKFGRGL